MAHGRVSSGRILGSVVSVWNQLICSIGDGTNHSIGAIYLILPVKTPIRHMDDASF